MKKDIKMSRDDMELNKYRAVIPYGDQEIIIRNIDRDLKNRLIDIIAEAVEKDEELDNVMIINMLVEELTNVEFEVPITEIVEPSHHTSMIIYYINEILTEVSEEILMAGQMVANNKKLELTSEMVKEQIEEDIKEVQEKIEENVPRKTVRKPQRGRGKISRK